VSRHTLDGVRRAVDEGADLIQLGPIWRTPGKGEPLGPLVLEGARAIIGSRAQLVAVGGIETEERVKAALRAGADGVAAIRAVWAGVLSGSRYP
jgi:thiamine monophosphate synthase